MAKPALLGEDVRSGAVLFKGGIAGVHGPVSGRRVLQDRQLVMGLETPEAFGRFQLRRDGPAQGHRGAASVLDVVADGA